jgi:hypothetical protein
MKEAVSGVVDRDKVGYRMKAELSWRSEKN